MTTPHCSVAMIRFLSSSLVLMLLFSVSFYAITHPQVYLSSMDCFSLLGQLKLLSVEFFFSGAAAIHTFRLRGQMDGRFFKAFVSVCYSVVWLVAVTVRYSVSYIVINISNQTSILFCWFSLHIILNSSFNSRHTIHILNPELSIYKVSYTYNIDIIYAIFSV